MFGGNHIAESVLRAEMKDLDAHRFDEGHSSTLRGELKGTVRDGTAPGIVLAPTSASDGSRGALLWPHLGEERRENSPHLPVNHLNV
ncbi:hypothetical protein DAETH_31480 [Deinococcus aetherius]|uniref:Uncharacterized protein n=1 Tax=Deinococcus aetherius TaxID=200252 RepID=A0ABM8AH93_9DEIO|nr:hypothetical protein DAETH_31480 [Deinococcus aetherius]